MILTYLNDVVVHNSCTDSDGGGGQGVWTPLGNYKIYVFGAILVMIPLKITKLLSQNSMSGYRNVIKWRP